MNKSHQMIKNNQMYKLAYLMLVNETHSRNQFITFCCCNKIGPAYHNNITSGDLTPASPPLSPRAFTAHLSLPGYVRKAPYSPKSPAVLFPPEVKNSPKIAQRSSKTLPRKRMPEPVDRNVSKSSETAEFMLHKSFDNNVFKKSNEDQKFVHNDAQSNSIDDPTTTQFSHINSSGRYYKKNTDIQSNSIDDPTTQFSHTNSSGRYYKKSTDIQSNTVDDTTNTQTSNANSSGRYSKKSDTSRSSGKGLPGSRGGSGRTLMNIFRGVSRSLERGSSSNKTANPPNNPTPNLGKS